MNNEEPMEDHGLGAVLTPPPAGARNVSEVMGSAPVPKQFVVPYRRGVLDEHYRIRPEEAAKVVRNQGAIDSCTAHGTARQKSAQEGVEIDEADLWRVGKPHDWRGLEAWGAPISAMQDGLVSDGACEARLGTGKPSMSRKEYTEGKRTPEQVENGKLHRGMKPYFVQRDMLASVAFQLQIPIVTGCMWHEQDNAIGKDGIMRPAASRAVGGHCFAYHGKVLRLVDGIQKECHFFENSFGPSWGDNGFFYVPIDGTENRLFEGYVTLDVPQDLSEILTRYSGKKVRVPGQPEHWLIEGGRKRRYADAFAWFAFGNLFGYGVYEIMPDELSAIPEGSEITIDQAPFEGRELVRQVRQTLGLK